MDAILFTTLPRNGGKFGPEVPIGWPNRLLVVAYAAWLIALARHVLSEAGAAESATSMKAASTAQ